MQLKEANVTVVVLYSTDCAACNLAKEVLLKLHQSTPEIKTQILCANIDGDFNEAELFSLWGDVFEVPTIVTYAGKTTIALREGFQATKLKVDWMDAVAEAKRQLMPGADDSQ